MNNFNSNASKQYIVSRMSKDELNTMTDWARREGWNPGVHDADSFYQADPNGFFVGKLDGKIIAMGSAIVYDEQYAFCGFYMVDPACRGMGYGLALTNERLDYIGARNAGLDGVVNMLDKYARLGYKLAHYNVRYHGQNLYPLFPKSSAIIPLSQIDFKQLAAYDRKYFPAPRDAFLSFWINQAGAKSLGYLEHNKLQGYGVIRPCVQGFKIGPLFAENHLIANQLFAQLVEHASGASIYMDVPESNPYAVKLIDNYHLEKVFKTGRMYLKEPPEINMTHVYGITSLELG